MPTTAVAMTKCSWLHVAALLCIALNCKQNVDGWCSPFPRSTRISESAHPRRLVLHVRTWQRGDDNYMEEEDDYYEADNYWHDDSYKEQRRGYDDDDESTQLDEPGPYNLYFSGGYEETEGDKVKWELCDDGTTWVLLPPPYVEMPTAVIHFVGGTFFGSSPKLWYRTLLEGLVRATECSIVATPIPVTLLKNPLRHVSLSRKLQRQFQSAYINILSDEYELSEQVPVVGMGHSLGARLLTVLATLSDKPSIMVPPYKAHVLMSFNNFGASASIPGIQSLLKQSKSLDEEPDRVGQRRHTRKQQRKRRDDYNDFYNDDDDEDWEELLDGFQGALKEQADKVKNALTPKSEELEFHPSPDQLWEALKNDKRYRIPNTLVVHFQDDEVDQSPRLADCLVKTKTSDVKYAWLRGNHLTPISAESEWLKFPEGASKALSRIVNGSSRGGASNAMRDLRQSIARYITDVVTK